MSKSLLGAACLLSSCVFTYSCSDEYGLDNPDEMPDFLGGSIYDELKARGNFSTTVRLIDDLAYAEVLAKTGSKTLFVANDDAYTNFFASTKWKDAYGNVVRSYDQLTTAQKKLLLNGTMLNNAYVMEMLSNTADGGKNLCLRQQTASTIMDTVPFFKGSELPLLTNEEDVVKKFWDDHRSGPGIYMALDRTQPYMTHFLEGFMKNSNIKKSDVALILNQRGTWADNGEDRGYIYGRKVVEQDVTCLNGYFNVIDGVLVQPSNMAEELRNSGYTNHFSHLLDRFSAPYLNEELTREYQALHPDVTAVYEKRYISARSQGNKGISNGPDKEPLGSVPVLLYDPGWNAYAANSMKNPENDMAAMFVPNDEALFSLFKEKGGMAYVERYANEYDRQGNITRDAVAELNHSNFNEITDKIPLTIIQALVNNLMKPSFVESVPSKYLSIMNDARDPMFQKYASQKDFENQIDRCILANNGVIYVMKEVISPADYSAVSAPVLTSGEAEVVNKVISIDDIFIDGDDYNSAPLKQYFSTYLKSMQSSFSFFVPTDEALMDYGYADPARYSTGLTGNLAKDDKLKFDIGEGDKFPIRMRSYKYDIKKDEVKRTLISARTSGANETGGTKYELKKKILVDMIDQHIVVHENEDLIGVQRQDQKYFESRSGAPVIVYDHGTMTGNAPTSNIEGMKVGGGFQEMANTNDGYADQYCTVTKIYNQSPSQGYGNGFTYFLDRAMEPAYKPVYSILEENPEFSKFFELVDGKLDQSYLEKMGLRGSMNTVEWEEALLRYQIMEGESDLGSDSEYFPPLEKKLVRFFNNYRYTVYVPTNEVLEKAIENGFPEWSDIEAYVEECVGLTSDGSLEPDSVMTPDEQAKAQTMLNILLNTLRYHFQDKAVYVDGYDVQGSKDGGSEGYQTSSLDEENNFYRQVKVKRSVDQITVNGVNVGAKHNLLARDIGFDNKLKLKDDKEPSLMKRSSFVVVHQLDGMLDFQEADRLFNVSNPADGAVDYNTYDWTQNWEDPEVARVNAAKYKISQ